MVKNVSFLHPRFSSAGFDQIIIDIARALTVKGNSVEIWTNKISANGKKRFDEKIKVETVCEAISGIFRHLSFLILTIFAILSRRIDIFVISEISCFIPLIRFFCPDARIIFIAKEIMYDVTKLTEKGIKISNLVYVTTQPNLNKFKKIYGGIKAKVIRPMVVSDMTEERTPCPFPLFAYIADYERENNHMIAIESLNCGLRNGTLPKNTKLVIAGNYDKNSAKCEAYFDELHRAAEKLDLLKNIEFRMSISEYEKFALFNLATASLYLQKHDTFASQPIESQSFGCPVIAVESPAVNMTCKCQGCFMTTDNPNDIAAKMAKCLKQKKAEKQLRENAKLFGFEMFCKQITDDIL